MRVLPPEFLSLLVEFSPFFSRRVWERVLILVAGSILSPGKRTVTSCLRVLGMSREAHFQNFHRVLNRARWSSLKLARVLVRMVVNQLVESGPVVIGLDETIERRRGEKITAKGIYRDPVRSSHSHFVKASGLRWMCAMILTEIPWAGRVWGLPVLTALCPSERFYDSRKRSPKKLTEWARQMIRLLHRWLPERELIFVGDNNYAVLEVLNAACRLPEVSVITRLRLDAALYEPAPKRLPGSKGRPRCKGERLPTLKDRLVSPEQTWTELEIDNWYGAGRRLVEIATGTAVWYHTGKPPVPIRWVLIRDTLGKFEPQALLCTNQDFTEEVILRFFMRCWAMEVTFEEARAHLGIETQRQWNDFAITRTTPALLGLFSLITLFAHTIFGNESGIIRGAAWYDKTKPTFSDAIAAARRAVWSFQAFSTSGSNNDLVKIPKALLERFTDALCYAA